MSMPPKIQAGEYEDTIVSNSSYEDGDWNGDGEFDSADSVLAFQAGHYNQVAAVVALCSTFVDDEAPSPKKETSGPNVTDVDVALAHWGLEEPWPSPHT
jgi:hypothetical protein